MPRLKQSLGTVKFTTPFPEEFQRYVMYELANAKQWNNALIKSAHGFRTWRYWTDDWSIAFDGQFITVTSDLPKVIIRQGLVFNMGNGVVEIKGNE